jgi:hypothetical protein
MPWKVCSVMDGRLQLVGRRLAGESMAELCREFGISRKTGYKIFERYQECGVQGLTDRSRRPYRYIHQLPFQVENYILNVKREHPSLVRARSENAWRGDSLVSRSRPKAPSMRCWIVMAWWSVAVARGAVRRAPPYRSASIPTNCGARITRASSCWAIANTATH